MGFGTQIVPLEQPEANSWSLCDIAIDLALMARATKYFWESIGFLGQAHMWAWLNLGDAHLLSTVDRFASAFYPGFSLQRNWVSLVKQERVSSVAELQIDYSSLASDLPRTSASILTQLLRGLGHKVHLNDLTEHLAALFAEVERYSERNRI